MKKYLRLTALALCAAMLAGCGGKGKGDMPMMNEEGTATNVEVANPTINTVKDEYMYSGTVQAAETVDVSAKVSGTVEATYFEVGDTVSKGDVLYKIDDTDYQNNLKSAQASLTSANASVQSAKTGVETANGATMKTQLESSKNAITSAETNLENSKKSLEDTEISVVNAQTNYDKAKSDYDIYKQLYDVGGLSEDALDTYRIALEQAENALTTAQNSKTKAELSVKSAQDTLEQANTSYNILSKETTAKNTRKANDSLNTALASQNSAQVAVNTAKQNISYCTVTSPISGTVLSKTATTGSMLSGVGYQIVDLTSVNVTVNASEQIATSVNVGDNVTIVIPSMSDEQFVGSITEIPPGANSDGTYTIKINIPNSTGTLKSGMFAEVYFAKSTSDNAVILPRDAVMDNDGEEYFVYVVGDGNTAKKVDVTVGIDTGDTIEVTSGITLNDKVVVNGQTYLAEGDALNIVSDNGVDTVSDVVDTADDTTAPAEAPAEDKGAKKK